MWENGTYTLHLSSNPYYRHEQIILSSGTPEGYLPMSFLRTSQGLTIRYEAGGYLPLSAFRIERTEDVLYLMDRTVGILHASPGYLLDPERILLRADTVFYGKDQDDLRIAYLPRQACESGDPSLPMLPTLAGRDHGFLPVKGQNPLAGKLSPFHCELVILLAELKQTLQDPCQDFLFQLARELYYMHPDTAQILRTIGLLRRRIDAFTRTRSTADRLP